MLKRIIGTSLVCLTASGAAADQTISDLASAASKPDGSGETVPDARGGALVTTLASVALPPDGSVTAAQT